MTFNYQVGATDNGRLELEGFIFVSSEKIVDGGGNSVPQPSSPITVSGITLDTTAPSVTNLALTNSSNTWSWSWGCSEAICKYRHEIKTSTGPATLSGNYGTDVTAAPGGGSADGTYYAHVQAKDAAGNESVVVASGANSISVGGTPVVKTLSGPVPKTYSLQESLDFKVTFDRSVRVTEVPQLPLKIGSVNRYANYFSGTNSNTLTFRYVAVSGDADSDGVALRGESINLNGGGLNGSTTVSLTAKTFTGVFVDTVPPVVTITSTHTDAITSINAAAYSVSGACKAGLAVEVRVGTVAPDSAPTCSGSGAWEATLNLGGLDKGATTITASQTDSVGTGSAPSVSATVGDFEQMVLTHPSIGLGGTTDTTPPVGHTCVIKPDGKLSCWGSNPSGQLGNNSTTHSDHPVNVRDHTGDVNTTLNDIIQVALGAKYTCALKSNGSVWCWGEGYRRQLGNDSRNDSHSPRAVNGINNTGQLNGVVQISVGYVHSCALGSNGQVSCWGDNGKHKLGHDGANTKSGYPRTVNISEDGPPLEGIVQISCGLHHTCALTSEGKVWCWGNNQGGTLGNGVSGGYNSKETYPVAVRDSSGTAGSTLSGVIQVSTGFSSSCALKRDGTVYCWGASSLGTSSSYLTSNYPLHVSRLSSVKAITQSRGSIVNKDVKCALDSHGRAKCWGTNQRGQMARGEVNIGSSILGSVHNPSNIGLPETIRASSTSGNTALEGVVEIRGGASHTCALMQSPEKSSVGGARQMSGSEVAAP